MTKSHIDITNKEQVDAITTGSGKVTQTTWNPNTGCKEAAEAAHERQRAFEIAMEQQRLDSNPELKRIAELEQQMVELRAEITVLKSMYGCK